MTFDAQSSMCDKFAKNKFGKVKIVSVIKSRESGVTLNRPHLLQAVRACCTKDAILVTSKVDRLARNITVFTSLLMLDLPIWFAEYPTLDMRKGTLAERSAVIRQALEGHLEGLRISERTRAVMPLVKKAGKKVGGQAHSKGSKKNKKLAQEEALRIKNDLLKYMKQNPQW